jgi:uncharacterized protein
VAGEADEVDQADILRHEPGAQRFVLRTEGRVATLDYRPITSSRLDYRHTFVPRELRGRGIASRLAEFALDYALEGGLEVVPTCPFVAAYIAANPRFGKLVVK